jgi:uncharacterized protein
MEVQRFDDAAAFAAQVVPYLVRAPARHNLFLGILDTLQRHPSTYPTFHLWAAVQDGEVVGAALQTLPHNLVLAEPALPGAIQLLVATVTDAGVLLPGVVGGVTEAQAFAAAWHERNGGDSQTLTRQGIYQLTGVREAGSASGDPKLAGLDDMPLLVSWHHDFLAEAVPHHVRDDEMMQRRLTAVVVDGGFWLWEAAGEVVSMTGVSPAPPDGARIGPVYTPPGSRGRGYATSLVAHVSDVALAHGSTRCYLHTDMANPTSNAIYQRIGYDWVCEAIDIRFATR